MDLRRPDRRTPRRLLVQKTYENVGTVWAMYVCGTQQKRKVYMVMIHISASATLLIVDKLVLNQRKLWIVTEMMKKT